MKSFLLQKESYVKALTEDVLFLAFFTAISTSTLEILLPGSVSNKIPLPFVFLFLGLVSLFYFSLPDTEKSKEKLVVIPNFALILTLIFCLLITLFLTRGFGIFGSLLQIVLLVAVVFIGLRKNVN